MPSSPTNGHVLFLGLLLLSAARVWAAPPPPAPDHSLEPAGYIEMGLPAQDREWTGGDYARALEVLKKIAGEDPTRLPRYESKASGTMFRRIASEDNLSLMRDKTVPIGQRLPDAILMMRNLGPILSVYMSATNGERTFDSELVEITREVLATSGEVSGLVEEFRASLPADDPQREVRERGVEQFRQGLATIVVGALTTLNEHQTYRTSELLRLADAIERLLPGLLPQLPPGVRAELPVRLRKMIADETDVALKDRLTRIEVGLHGKPPAETPPGAPPK